MATWPTTLPDPLLAGYSRQPVHGVLRTSMDVGPAKVRRRSTAETESIGFTVHLTGAQRATLDTFYKTTLESGSLSFDWVDHDSGAAAVYRFLDAPSYVPLGNDRYTASLQLEMLP